RWSPPSCRRRSRRAWGSAECSAVFRTRKVPRKQLRRSVPMLILINTGVSMDRDQRSDRYRALARECEERAQKAGTPKEAVEWIRVARSWLMVAEEIDALEGLSGAPRNKAASKH